MTTQRTPPTRLISLRVPVDLMDRLQRHANDLSMSLGGARVSLTMAALHLMQHGATKVDAAAASDPTLV